MQLIVHRRWFTPLSTIGEINVVAPDGESLTPMGFTLEPTHREIEGRPVEEWKIADGERRTAIPAGTYPITIRWSHHFARLMPHVENVPGFSEVMLHWGNKPADTEACSLTGLTHSTDWVGNSHVAFAALFEIIQTAIAAGDPVTITYSGLPSGAA